MRCRICGSNKIGIKEQSEGYSMSKGLVGAAILGPVGAVAGIDGKKSTMLYCPFCHEQSDYMDAKLDLDISMAIRMNEIVKLRKYKIQYPGIEWTDEYTPDNQKKIENKQDAVKSNDLEADVLSYMNSVNMPVTYNDLCKEFSGNDKEDVFNTILSLIENGRLKCVQEYFVIVRDVEELLELKGKGKEKREEVIRLINAFDRKATNDSRIELLRKKCQSNMENDEFFLKSSLEEMNSNSNTTLEQGEPIDLQPIIARIESLEHDLNDHKNKKKELEKEFDLLQKEYDGLKVFDRSRKKTLKDSIQNMQMEIEGCDYNINKTIKNIANENNRLSLAKRKNAKREKQIHDNEEAINKRKQRIEDLKKSIEGYKNALQLLDEGKTEGVPEHIMELVDLEEKLAPSILTILRAYGGSIDLKELANQLHKYSEFRNESIMRLSAASRITIEDILENVSIETNREFKKLVILNK